MRSGNNKQGITLLLSLLIVAVLFTIAFSVADLTIKEFELAALGRESQKTYYAAETGFDCANWWQVNYEVFSTTTPTPPRIISCDGKDFTGYPLNPLSTGFDRTVTQAHWGSPPTVPSIPVINLVDYNGQPVRVIVEPPLTTPNVAIQAYAENTAAPSYARKVQRTFGGLTGACFQNADIMFLLDISGSMVPAELAIVRTSAQSFIDTLSPSPGGVNIGLVTFGSPPGSAEGGGGFCAPFPDPSPGIDTKKVCMRSPLTGDGVAVKTIISDIGDGEIGLTDMGDAVMLAVQELYENDRPDGTNPDFIVMLTDGAPNLKDNTHDSPFFPGPFPPFSPTVLPLSAGTPTPYTPSPFFTPPPHVHSQANGENDDLGTYTYPPDERLELAEASSAATVAKGSINNIKIFALGVGITDLDGASWLRNLIVSSPDTQYYYAVTDPDGAGPLGDFDDLDTELQRLGTCQLPS